MRALQDIWREVNVEIANVKALILNDKHGQLFIIFPLIWNNYISIGAVENAKKTMSSVLQRQQHFQLKNGCLFPIQLIRIPNSICLLTQVSLDNILEPTHLFCHWI